MKDKLIYTLFTILVAALIGSFTMSLDAQHSSQKCEQEQVKSETKLELIYQDVQIIKKKILGMND